ncbi:hypothetical protein Tco_1422692 [Tanacetum coccineum]
MTQSRPGCWPAVDWRSMMVDRWLTTVDRRPPPLTGGPVVDRWLTIVDQWLTTVDRRLPPLTGGPVMATWHHSGGDTWPSND